MGVVQDGLVGLLARGRGGEGAGADAQPGMDVLEDAVQCGIAIVVGGIDDVEKGTAGGEDARLREGGGDEGGPFLLLDLHSVGDRGPVEDKGMVGIDKVGRRDHESERGSKFVQAFMPQTNVMRGYSERSLGKCFMKDF